ncbi:MAG: ABC transporter ATP-binding protein [Legionellaceae bacterium]|nr:ABC transporter ATP-binding protein [Legionellaceae bacterium]
MFKYVKKLINEISDVTSASPRAISISSILTLAKVASVAAFPLMLSRSLDEMEEESKDKFEQIAPWMLGYTGLWALSELIPYLQENVLHPVAMNMSFGLTHRIMDTFYSLPMEARASNTNAPAVQHFNSAYEHLGNAFITTTFSRTIPSLLEILVIDGLVIYEDLDLGLVLLGVIITYSTAAVICSKYISDSQNQYIGSLCVGYEFIISQLDQYENAHYYGNVPVELQNLDVAMRKLGKDFQDALAFKSTTSAFLSGMFGLSYIGALTYAAYLFDSEEISAKKIIILMLYILQSGMSLRAFSDSFGKLVSNYQTFKLLEDYLDTKSASEPTIGYSPLIQREQAAITFQQVAFNYGDDKSDLINISFTAKPGSVTAITGRSGSGKSTLIRLLMGFYSPTTGAIFLGNKEISTFDPTDLRENFAVVPQNAVIFSGSIADNIKYGNLSATDADVLEAARQAGLADLIAEDRMTANTGSSGRKLSGGQKQRISIARAYLRSNAAFLVLDEPTSALDPITEKEVLRELSQLIATRNVTVMIITHNLDTLRQYIKVDNIIDVDLYSEQFISKPKTPGTPILPQSDALGALGMHKSVKFDPAKSPSVDSPLLDPLLYQNSSSSLF